MFVASCSLQAGIKGEQLKTRKISFVNFSSKMCNLCQAGTTTVLVEYKTLKQTSRFHFSQKDQGSNFLRTPGLFACWEQSGSNAKIR